MKTKIIKAYLESTDGWSKNVKLNIITEDIEATRKDFKKEHDCEKVHFTFEEVED